MWNTQTGRSSRHNLESRPALDKGPPSKHTSYRNQLKRTVCSNHLQPHMHVSVEGQEVVLDLLVYEQCPWFISPVASSDGLVTERFGILYKLYTI